MKLSDFDYDLPRELIAQYPLSRRDSSRLLVIDRAKKTIEHKTFRDAADYFKKGDLLVLNDTKVLSCRLIGKRVTGGRVDVLLLKKELGPVFEAMVKPGKIRIGEDIIFDQGRITGRLIYRNRIRFNTQRISDIYRSGVMPIPPYIKRLPEESDREHYQTVYARKEGAVASPTAGLHFTKEFLKQISSGGVKIGYLTLHVGSATFKPVKTEDIKEHKMNPEYFQVPEGTIKLIKDTRRGRGRVIAVGTTSLRALETYARGVKKGNTRLFVYPGYRFKVVDGLLTNFHLPRTTLFMLVCAFAGEELAKRAYKEAIENRYRFYSYGDAMLIL